MSNINKTKLNTIKLPIVVLIATGYVSSVCYHKMSTDSQGSRDSTGSSRSIEDEYGSNPYPPGPYAITQHNDKGGPATTFFDIDNNSSTPSVGSTASSRSSSVSGSLGIAAYQETAIALQNNDVIALFKTLSLQEGQNYDGHEIIEEMLYIEKSIEQIRLNSRNFLYQKERFQINLMMNRYAGLMNFFMSVRGFKEHGQGHRLFQKRLNELQDSVPDHYFGKKSNSSVLHSWRLEWSTKLYPEGHVEDLGEQIIDNSDYSYPDVILYYNPYHKDAHKSQRERCIHFTTKIGDTIFGFIPMIHVQDDDENHMVKVHFGTLPEQFSGLPNFLAKKGIFLLQDEKGLYARPPFTYEEGNRLLDEKLVRAFGPINGIAEAYWPLVQVTEGIYGRIYCINDHNGGEIHRFAEYARDPNTLPDKIQVNYGPGHLISSLIPGTLEIKGDVTNGNLLTAIVLNVADDAIVLQTTDSPQGSDLDIRSPTPEVGSSEFRTFLWPSKLPPIQSGDASEASSSKHTPLPLSTKEVSGLPSPLRQRPSTTPQSTRKEVADSATSPIHFSIADDIGTQTDQIESHVSTQTDQIESHVSTQTDQIESHVSTQTDHKAGKDISTETASGPAQEAVELSAEPKRYKARKDLSNKKVTHSLQPELSQPIVTPKEESKPITTDKSFDKEYNSKITLNDNHISSGVLIKPAFSTLEDHDSTDEGPKNTTNLSKSDASDERMALKRSNIVSEFISFLKATYNLFV
jgi:hypothetical protein